MIVKRNFNPIKVIEYVKTELAVSAIIAILVYVLHKQQIVQVTLPFSIATILGSALAIFIAFRNNSAYSRWWEARTLWSGITNASRVLARLIITFTDSHAHQPNYDKNRSDAFKKEMVYLTIAWVQALRMHLRNEDNWSELQKYFNTTNFEQCKTTQNKPNFIQMLMGKKIYEAMANGTLGGFDSFQMEGQLLALANYQGNCERIKNTPLLRQYNYFTKLFLYTFMLLLPFTLIGDFAKLNIAYLMPAIALVISFVFAVIGKVGEVNEDPFENKITDVPLTAICNNIEIDLREMLGENNLPEKAAVKNGYLY